MSDVTLVENDLFYMLDKKKKPRKLARKLMLMIKNHELPFNETYDIIISLLKRDNEYFIDKVYPFLQISLGGRTSQMTEMDEYIFKKFCFLEGEDIVDKFFGSISEKKVNSTGRIYLTNYRIILSGIQVVRSAQHKGYGPGRPGWVGMAFRSGITRRRQAVRRAITKTLRVDINSLDLVEWGYYFPVHEAFKIKLNKKNKSISYSITVETEKKPVVLSLKVTPIRLKPQTKEEFLKQKEHIISRIHELLLKFQ